MALVAPNTPLVTLMDGFANVLVFLANLMFSASNISTQIDWYSLVFLISSHFSSSFRLRTNETMSS